MVSLCTVLISSGNHVLVESSEEEDADFEDEGPSRHAPTRRTTASNRSTALEEMKRRRVKGRASDDQRRALELALSGGIEQVTSSGGSRGKSASAERGTKRGRSQKSGAFSG